MHRITLCAATLLTAGTLALAAPDTAQARTTEIGDQSIWIGTYGRLHSWRAVSRDELIIWAMPSKPYLVRIWRPATGLRFAERIGVSSTAGRITKFDSVFVNGYRAPIKSIEALDKEVARAMTWSGTGSQP